MTASLLGEILSGHIVPTTRADLHADLDALLDAADEDGGKLDPVLFWAFVAECARGRGIADDIAAAAGETLAADGTALAEVAAARAAVDAAGASGNRPSKKDKAARAALAEKAEHLQRAHQWALLSALVARVTLYPGEVMPADFSPAAFRAVAANLAAGAKGGEHMDILGAASQRGSADQAMRRTARQLLVAEVYSRVARHGGTVDDMRNILLPGLPRDTWQTWTREAARAKRMTVKAMAAEIRAKAVSDPAAAYPGLDADRIDEMFRMAWFRR